MAIHSFVGRSPDGKQCQYYGTTFPTAADGNAYIIGDWIENRPNVGTAMTPGDPLGWICITAGTGATSAWLAVGSSQSINPSVLSGTTGVVQAIQTGDEVVLKFNITFDDITAGASPISLSLFTPPAKSLVTKTFIKQATSFTGGGLTAMTLGIGTAGSTTRYSGSAFDIFQAAAGNTFQVASPNSIDSWSAPAAVLATFTSTSANPNAATAGSVDIYVWLSAVR